MTNNELAIAIKVFQRELEEQKAELARKQLDDEEDEEEDANNG